MTISKEILKKLPKAELHCHLDGSLRVSTIIELADGVTNKKEIEKIILINVPSEIYTELRKIFVFVFESSGFKDIKISNNVDFQKLYNLKKVQ